MAIQCTLPCILLMRLSVKLSLWEQKKGWELSQCLIFFDIYKCLIIMGKKLILSFNFCINLLELIKVTEPYSFASCGWLDLWNDQGSVEESRNSNNIRNLPNKWKPNKLLDYLKSSLLCARGILTAFLISWKPPRILTKMNPVDCISGAAIISRLKQIVTSRKSIRKYRALQKSY